jgi:hypothetical protein|tara:strand:- start:8654 stop:8896 length:243 start_codon:yes stop_codon:yes gene_type:complete
MQVILVIKAQIYRKKAEISPNSEIIHNLFAQINRQSKNVSLPLRSVSKQKSLNTYSHGSYYSEKKAKKKKTKPEYTYHQN